MCYVHEQNNNDSGLFFFLGDWRGVEGGGGAGSRPETSCVEGSGSRPAVATGGKRRRGSGSASSGVDEVLLVLVEAMFALSTSGAAYSHRCASTNVLPS